MNFLGNSALNLNFRVSGSNQVFASISVRVRDNVEVLTAVCQSAVFVSSQFKADRVQSELKFRRRSNEQ